MLDIVVQIEELYDFVLSNVQNELKMVDIGIISGELAQKIKDELMYDLDNYFISIDNYAISHCLKQHSLENEKNKKQKPVDKVDILLLPEIVFNADNIRFDRRKGKDYLFFQREIVYNYIALFEIRTVISRKKAKKSRICLQTMYIKKPLSG